MAEMTDDEMNAMMSDDMPAAMKTKMRACMKGKMKDDGMKADEAMASCKKTMKSLAVVHYRAVKPAKSITDAPNLRDRMMAACSCCKFFQPVEGDPEGMGACSLYDFHTERNWVCDSFEMVPESMPAEQMMQAMSDMMDMGKAVQANTLKTLSKTDDELRVANYIILFGGRDLTAFGGVGNKKPIAKNADGSSGEYFTAKTILESPYTAIGRLPVDWEHGLLETDPHEVLGYVDWSTKSINSKGVFVQRVLNRRNRYVQWLEELIDEGLISNSTKSIAGRDKRNADGEIVEWQLERDTLTVIPAEPRMMKENILHAMKSLGIKTVEGQAMPAAQDSLIATGTGLQNVKTIITEVKMTEEEKRLADEQAAKLKEQGDKLVTLEGNLKTATEQIGVLTEALKKEKPAASGVQVEPAQKYPYKPFIKSASGKIMDATGYGEFLQDVYAGDTGTRSVAPRLANWVDMNLKSMKAAAGMNVTVPSQGGFFVQTDHATELIYMMIDQDDIISRVRKIPLGPNADGITINGVDETSRASTIWGGILAYWLAEADAVTSSKPKFRQIKLEVKGLAALYYATDKVLRVAPALGSEASNGFREAMAFKVRDAIINGSGVGKPLGLLSSGSIVSVAKETNQVAATLVHENISNMKKRMFPSSFKNAVWLANMDTQSQWDQLAFTIGAAGVLSPYVRYTDDGVLTVHGKPVLFTEHCATLGTTGDVILWDPSSYYFVDLGAIEEASSIHVSFTTFEQAFRYLYMVDAQPKLASALTPAHGSNTLTTHVKLDTRA